MQLRYHGCAFGLHFFAHIVLVQSQFVAQLEAEPNENGHLSHAMRRSEPAYKEEKFDFLHQIPHHSRDEIITFNIPRLQCKPGQVCMQNLQHQENNIVIGEENDDLNDKGASDALNPNIKNLIGATRDKNQNVSNVNHENNNSSKERDISELIKDIFASNRDTDNGNATSRRFLEKRSKTDSDNSNSGSNSKSAEAPPKKKKGSEKNKRFEVVENDELTAIASTENKFESEEVKVVIKKKKPSKKKETEEKLLEIAPDTSNLSVGDAGPWTLSIEAKTQENHESDEKHGSEEIATYIQGPGRMYNAMAIHSEETTTNPFDSDENTKGFRSKKHKQIDEIKPQKKTKEHKARRSDRMQYFLPKRILWSQEDIPKLGNLWFNGVQGKRSYLFRRRRP